MPVSIKKAEEAGLKSVHEDTTYYFSSDECKARFDADPEKYASRAKAGPEEKVITPVAIEAAG